jgi:hypothetical protein
MSVAVFMRAGGGGYVKRLTFAGLIPAIFWWAIRACCRLLNCASFTRVLLPEGEGELSTPCRTFVGDSIAYIANEAIIALASWD